MGLDSGVLLTAAFCLRAAAIKHLEGERSGRNNDRVSHVSPRTLLSPTASRRASWTNMAASTRPGDRSPGLENDQ